MPRIRNAFKIRAADAPIIDTAQFLQLYCPLILGQLQKDDLLVPRLIVVRGSPGSGKSSLLRLFEVDTLLAVHAKRTQSSIQDLAEQLTELGILSESGPAMIGVYIQCDSSLQDIANVLPEESSIGLLFSLLDMRIMALFFRGLRRLSQAGCLALTDDQVFEPLAAGEAPPQVFAQARTIRELENICGESERAFGTLLNAFPGDPLPAGIQPHARVYSLAYLSQQISRIPALSAIVPLIMLDDIQELYPNQRERIRQEFLRRSGVPRWLAVRTHVFGLEELVSLEGAQLGREYREIALDEIFQERPGVFAKFSANVIHRRLQATDSIQDVTVNDFKDLLRSPEPKVSSELALRAISAMRKQSNGEEVAPTLNKQLEEALRESSAGGLTFEMLMNLEVRKILSERKIGKGQKWLFEEGIALEEADAKAKEAARLFLSRYVRWPYYFGFDVLSETATGNVEQLLSTTATIVDRMIYRAELDRDKAISAKEQEDILKKCGAEYYSHLEQRIPRGSAVKQFVDNLGAFFDEVTYRPNAPIAPGVNGFGLSKEELARAAAIDKSSPGAGIFREILKNAVAGNVLTVRNTKQGTAGRENIVFYLNRLLCLRFRLPLNYGGWQHISVANLIRMMQAPVRPSSLGRQKRDYGTALWETET